MNKSLILMALIGLGAMANAGINAVGGATTIVSPPASVRDDQTESDTKAILFLEKGDVALGANLNVDAVAAGTYNGVGTLSTSQITAGTHVASYLLHADPVGDLTRTWEGSMTFDEKILGVIATQAHLNDSDPILGNNGTIYPTGSPFDTSRGFELSTAEYFVISSDLKSIRYRCVANTQFDQIRIVTESVPEPTTMTALGLGLAGLVRKARRKA